MNNLRNDLLEANKEGKFLEFVYKNTLRELRENRTDLYEELIYLHNEGLINIVDVFKKLENSGKHDFFLTRNVFEKVLPRLETPIYSVMECVIHLIRQAGQDMAAGTTFAPFIDFCAADTVRPKEALTYIEGSTEQFADLLPSVIIAGTRLDLEYYFYEAIRLSKHRKIIIRTRAIFSLGRIIYPEGSDLIESAFAFLENVVNIASDDLLLANLTKSCFSLYKFNRSLKERCNELIKKVVIKGKDYTLHAISEIFFSDFNDVYMELLDTILNSLLRINPKNKGTLDNVDYGLHNLLQSGDKTRGLEFIEKLFVTRPNDLSFEDFDSVIAELRKDENRGVLNKLITRWFLSGNIILCNCIVIIINAANSSEMLPEVDFSEINNNNSIIAIFLARKAIGYLFTQPVTAANIIISIMKHTVDDETMQGLSDLLFTPLLINYPGKVKEFLTKQKDSYSDRVKFAIEDALKALDDYLQNIKSVGEIPELHPSQSQRDTYWKNFTNQMNESLKKAQKESVLLSLVSKSVLLYGKKSINYIYDKKGQSRRMEMPLHSHGTEVEYPRIDNLDPFGLDYMIRVFRVERLKYEVDN
jgi:hypothetical protein